ncbi:class I SAM-dependent methyltransferase [Halomontanus rarus]|uniref:class I SAM-dependent methyltransferase n=1 Tax=Halomontanus rarus TaxID=3034020 RepID=UPI0023E7B13A|nr:class I SAM-dependent methyltransferase [Halovivax sp. TS33]
MPNTSDHPVAHRAYDKLAAGYDREGDTKPANAYLERPATLSLLPNVEETHVLDAGCGAGHLTKALSDRGATVVGLDVRLEPALEAGFQLDRLLESTPTEECRQADPEGYEYEATRPNFLCLRFLAPTQTG